MKKIDLLDLNEKDKQHCYGEVEAMRNLHHQNIVKFHDSFKHDEGRYLIIVMEYCQGGSLKNYIQRSQPMSEQGCLEITRDVSSALEVSNFTFSMYLGVQIRYALNAIHVLKLPSHFNLIDMGIRKVALQIILYDQTGTTSCSIFNLRCHHFGNSAGMIK